MNSHLPSSTQHMPVNGLVKRLLLLLLVSMTCFYNSFAAVSKMRNAFTTTISSINTVTTSTTNTSSVQYIVTFASAVTGLGMGNFTLTTSGVTGATIASLTGTGTTYTVTVNTGSGDGTIELDLANSTGISPGITTSLPFAGQSYTIDKTLPSVTSLYESSSNVNYAVAVVGDVITLIFGSDEPIQSSAVTIGGHNITAVSTGGNNYKATYTMTADDPNGRIHFTLQFVDLAGNTSVLYNDSGAGDDVEFDKTAPSASAVSFVSNNSNNATAINGNVVTLTFTSSVSISAPAITIAGHSITATNTTGNTYTASYTMVGADNPGNIPFEADLIGSNGNKTIITNVTTGDNIVFNNTPTLAATGTPATLSTVHGVASSSTSFKISGFNIGTGITVNAPTGFEVSTDNINFSSFLTLAGHDVIPQTTIYARLNANDLDGTYGNDFLLSSTNASVVHLTAATSTVAVALGALSVSSVTLSPAFNGNTISYTASVPSSLAGVTVTANNNDGVATIKVNGTSVTPGSASGNIVLNTGNNVITVVITSLDATLTKTYTITINKAVSTIAANLANFKISSGTLTPVFSANTISYAASVPNSVASITVTPTLRDSLATVKVNNVPVANRAASQAIGLSAGGNVITTIVTASDGVTTKTYTLTIIRAPSSNANLANITLSSGTLSPVFAGGTTGYIAYVSNATTSVKLTPTVADGTATVKVNGATVLSGSASASIPVALGDNTITTVVTAQDGSTIKTYTVIVNRISTLSANLANFKLSSGAIAPPFSANTVNYTAIAPDAVAFVTVTPTLRDSLASVTVNGVAVANRAASGPIALIVGDNKITTIVTAEDGITTKTYTLTVSKPPSTNADLVNLKVGGGTLSPVFATANTSYTATVPNTTTAAIITPTTSDALATVKVNGFAVASGSPSAGIPLVVGANTVTTVVTASDGTSTKTYTIAVTRLSPVTSANLANFKISSGTLSPAFSANTISYTASVANNVTSIMVTPTLRDSLATVTVNNVAATNRTATAPITLAVGDNTITTTVTAPDGVSSKTYTLVVTRATGALGFAGGNTGSSFSSSDDGIKVHQGLSPNGDGANDILIIEGLAAYPDNSLLIMDRSGQTVYETKGYDNTYKVFDGHSSRTGKMQQAGTYFYSLEYKVGDVVKHKTGYIVLRY